jgi:tRNA dimethylallyltransferase
LPLLVVLLGPTGSGKTALSLRLAEAFQGEVVSCDSVAVYREFEIGTAKPGKADRLKIPHHLVDIVSPGQSYSAGEYSRDARAAILEITARRRLPIVTGGTGLYLRALLNGLFQGPARSEDLRQRLRASEARVGAGHLHRLLQRLDPAAARAIHGNDVPKLIRAVEVCLTAGRPLTEAWADAASEPLRGYRILRIGIGGDDRGRLYERINHRAATMFEQGLVEETRLLLEKYGVGLRTFDALGYRQAAAHLRGECTLADAIQMAQQGHRNYAKRQLTWFRKEPDVYWLEGFGDSEETQEQALLLIKDALA